MDNNDVEQLINLTAERFYLHIQEQYGNLVEKVLRYHDTDSYIILDQVGKSELIDLFEKPNDENSTVELINLKKEICNISHDSASLKIGTENKIIALIPAHCSMAFAKSGILPYDLRTVTKDKIIKNSLPLTTTQSEKPIQKFPHELNTEPSFNNEPVIQRSTLTRSNSAPCSINSNTKLIL